MLAPTNNAACMKLGTSEENIVVGIAFAVSGFDRLLSTGKMHPKINDRMSWCCATARRAANSHIGVVSRVNSDTRSPGFTAEAATLRYFL